jgi:hypothetical protein
MNPEKVNLHNHVSELKTKTGHLPYANSALKEYIPTYNRNKKY